MDNDSLETFEDLFEPFELEQQEQQQRQARVGAPGADTGEVAPVKAPPTTAYCNSCGSANSPENRHCEACGALLARSRTPVAPQPMLRTTAGGRALLVLAGIVLTVAVLALFVNLIRNDGGETPVASSSTTSSSLATDLTTELAPIRVDCNETSELAAFPCEALIDGDPATYWNAPDGGIGAELTFLFSPAVQITEMLITNLDDDERFLRNARIKGIEVLIDDLPQATVAELEDTQDVQRIQIRSLRTSSLTIRITSAYPGQSVGDNEPFPELAAQSITFFGRAAPEQTTP
jgi:hypothetical protein